MDRRLRKDAGQRRAVYCNRKMLAWQDAQRTFFAICKALRISPEAIRSHYRGQIIVEKRDIIAYVLRSRHATFTDIGLLLNRDHSTVYHAVHKIAGLLKGTGGDSWQRLINIAGAA